MKSNQIRELREMLYSMAELKIETLTEPDEMARFQARMRYLDLSNKTRVLEQKINDSLSSN